jgi:hypothetical protein
MKFKPKRERQNGPKESLDYFRSNYNTERFDGKLVLQMITEQNQLQMFVLQKAEKIDKVERL